MPLHGPGAWQTQAAGEILLTSMDRDGTRVGFDLELTRAVADAVTIPVIASGGVGTLDHLVEGIRDGHATAVLAASIFHFGTHSICEAKAHMRAAASQCGHDGACKFWYPSSLRGAGGNMKRDQAGNIIDELFGVIEKRKGGDPETSYVARTFSRGREHVAKKVGEEGVEVALAGALGDKKAVVSESADLLFHLLILWSDTGVAPAEVLDELSKRRGVSGLAREARKRKAGDKR